MSSPVAHPGRVSVRLADDRDMGPIADLINEQILTARAHFGVATEPAEVVAEQWRRAGDRYPWLVAEDHAGAFLGFARAHQWKTREAYDWTVESAIYLTEAARGRRVGTLLYRALFETLRDQGFVVVLGGMTMPNPVSQRLHESMGMTLVGTFDPVGFKFGRWMPVRYYHKMLRDLAPEEDPGALRPVSSVWAPGRVVESPGL